MHEHEQDKEVNEWLVVIKLFFFCKSVLCAIKKANKINRESFYIAIQLQKKNNNNDDAGLNQLRMYSNTINFSTLNFFH